MNLHEYQAKELFARAGIPIAPGIVATTPAEARAAAQKIGGAVVVKAQVHSGGRGKAGDALALDAKVSIDDNELDRRPDLAGLRDETAEEPSEVLARKANLTFIKLNGNVGCVVNGAGLAMATMDLVKYYGGEPANFLDIGGSSNPEKVVNALKIITSDKSVKAILFNIFGGITRTDDVANGIVTALNQFKVEVPIVVRLTGTNEAEAFKILKGIGMTALSDMDEAVQQVVKLVKEAA
jgi:succinyl-CoA synthetase beta subunit